MRSSALNSFYGGMMADTVFRTRQDITPVTEPQNAPQSPSDAQGTSTVVEDTLLATYQDEVGTPYTAQYFEIPSVWSDDSMRESVQAIENHLRVQVSEKQLANTTKAAEKYLRSLEKKADVDPIMDSPSKRLDRLVAYIEFLDYIK